MRYASDRAGRRSPAVRAAFGVALVAALAAAGPPRQPRVPPADRLCYTEPPIEFSVARTRSIVRDAEVVVRASALGLTPAPPGSTRKDATYVKLFVREVLKGDAGDTLRIPGALDDRDSFQEGPVPYLLNYRWRGGGECMAYTYRPGAEYLLIMGRSVRHGISPYWRILAPTNEQVRGADDPWVGWVRQELSAANAR